MGFPNEISFGHRQCFNNSGPEVCTYREYFLQFYVTVGKFTVNLTVGQLLGENEERKIFTKISCTNLFYRNPVLSLFL